MEELEELEALGMLGKQGVESSRKPVHRLDGMRWGKNRGWNIQAGDYGGSSGERGPRGEAGEGCRG